MVRGQRRRGAGERLSRSDGILSDLGIYGPAGGIIGGVGFDSIEWGPRVGLPVVLREGRDAFLTLRHYSLIAVANAIEPLRMANRLVGRDVYEWVVISLDGRA